MKPFLIIVMIVLLYLMIQYISLCRKQMASEKWITPIKPVITPITTIITTCCRKSAPDTNMIVDNVKKIQQFAPTLTKKIIIVFDGPIIKNNALDSKCKGPCHLENYTEYVKNTKERIVELLPNSEIRFIEMSERSCLVNSLRAGIDAADTEFINIVQEDLILQKPLPVETMISAIRYNPGIDIVRYNTRTNEWHDNYCQHVGPSRTSTLPKHIISINDTYFSKARQYSDQCQISTKEYYYKFVFPNVNEFSFMENHIACEIEKKIPGTIWHLGRYHEGYYVDHGDGRNYETKQVKKCLAVSGYWNLHGRQRASYSHQKYLDNLSKSINFNADYFVFGDEDFIHQATIHRKNKTTYTKKLTWDELVACCESSFHTPHILEVIKESSLHRDQSDGEIHCPSQELLLVWLSKILLVKKAMVEHPEYSHYGWIDAGYKGMNDEYPSQETWPGENLDKVKGFFVKKDQGACHPQYWKRNSNDGCPIGGMWFGDKDSVHQFIQLVSAIIVERLRTKQTICTEQDIYQVAIEQINNVYTTKDLNNYRPFWLSDF